MVFGGDGRLTYRGRPWTEQVAFLAQLAQREKRARFACERARKRLASRLQVYVSLFVCLFVRLSICLNHCLSVCLSARLSVPLSLSSRGKPHFSAQSNTSAATTHESANKAKQNISTFTVRLHILVTFRTFGSKVSGSLGN